MEHSDKKDKFRKALNVLLAIAVFGAWGRMVVSGEGTLASTGLSSLKYFTVLSNLLEGFACLYWLAGKGAKGERLKFVATVAVSITFLVVMTFLGPLYGYPFMFEGANLWFHLPNIRRLSSADHMSVGDIENVAQTPAGPAVIDQGDAL